MVMSRFLTRGCFTTLIKGLRHDKIRPKPMQSRFKGRNYSVSKSSMEGTVSDIDDGPLVRFKFIEKESDDTIEVFSSRGKKMVDVALENDVNIEAACGGELACSTCHVVLEQALYDKLPPKKEEEEDMLDLAVGLTKTSRLSCQIDVTEILEGAEVLIPGDNY